MARKKEYNEEEVIEKAMNLFWRNGYESTSMNMLEKEMGINKFSIYSSFVNKDGVYVESIKYYKKKLNALINTLRSSSNGSDGIKQYFYDFIEFTKETELGKGCLASSALTELREDTDERIMQIISNYSMDITQAFTDSLRQDKTKDNGTIEEQVDYLIVSMFGLTFATRVFNKSQLSNYIENIFKNV